MGPVSQSTLAGIQLHRKWKADGTTFPGKLPRMNTSNASPETIHTKEPRKKARMYELSDDMKACKAKAKAADVRHLLPGFGYESVETMAEFVELAIIYFAKYCAGYRRRTSKTVNARNIEIQKKIKKGSCTDKLLPFHPDEMYSISYWCVHGCCQTTRGKNKRIVCSTRFTGCPARFTGELREKPNGDGWHVVITNEITMHNHAVSEEVYRTYDKSAKPFDEILFEQIAWGIHVGGDPRILRDEVSCTTGTTFTQRKFDNLVQYWLGGNSVLENVTELLERFSSLDGSRSLVIKDDNGTTAGIVLQSNAQRAIFELYGDSLVLDWTHNTNNMGFHLGSLMVTTATGKGVSVCDFLCVSQSSVMMKTVFEFFLEHNPSGKTILQSFVIDKDFREWKSVVAVFQVSVVLCIFHVLKWFKFVTTRPKYSIGFAIRDAVLQCLRNMVYAVSREALEAQKIVLRGLLDPSKNISHAAFLKYMEVNWYGDADMWCYAGRGAIFTAGNTTSNRLESFWNQFKALLGLRRRLDYCLETIFQHGTAILRREKELLQGYINASPLLHDVDQNLRPLLMDLSPYAAKQVKAQWVKFKAKSGLYTATRVRPRAGDPHCTHTVHVAGARAVDFAVSTTAWTCSCHFYRGVRLPCRHIFYVMDVVQDMAVYPANAVPKRWRMSEYGLILPTLSRSISELEQLRTHLLQTSYLADQPLPCLDVAPPRRASSGRTIVYTRLRKNEISDSSVMGEVWKRNESGRVLDKVVAFGMTLPVPHFKDFMCDVEELVADMLTKWSTRMSHVPTPPEVDSQCGATAQPAARDECESAEWFACRASAEDEPEYVPDEESIPTVTMAHNDASSVAVGALGVVDDALPLLPGSLHDEAFEVLHHALAEATRHPLEGVDFGVFLEEIDGEEKSEVSLSVPIPFNPGMPSSPDQCNLTLAPQTVN